MIDIKSADTMNNLFDKVTELLHISTMTDARQQIMEQVQSQMASFPEYHRKSTDNLDEISDYTT